MDFSLKQAFTYCFTDKKLARKTLIGCLFMILIILCIVASKSLLTRGNIILNPQFLCVVSLAILEAVMFCFMIWGYVVKNTHSRVIDPEHGLCEWGNIVSDMKYGIFSFIFPPLATIPVLIVMGLIIGAVLGVFIYLDTSNIYVDKLIFYAFMSFFGAITFVLALLVMSASRLCYSIDLKASSFFRYRAIKRLLLDNFGGYIKYLIFMVLALIISSLIISIFVGICYGAFYLIEYFMPQINRLETLYQDLALFGCVLVFAVMGLGYLMSVLCPYYAYSDISAQFLRNALGINKMRERVERMKK